MLTTSMANLLARAKFWRTAVAKLCVKKNPGYQKHVGIPSGRMREKWEMRVRAQIGIKDVRKAHRKEIGGGGR